MEVDGRWLTALVEDEEAVHVAAVAGIGEVG